MRRWLLIVIGVVGLAVQPPAVADDPAVAEIEQALQLPPNLENGKRIYAGCVVCHQPEGWGTVDGRYPQIAGQYREALVKQLADMRARNRDNPMMYPFTLPPAIKGAQDIADVTAYIHRLPMTPHTGVGPGTDLALGERLYTQHCLSCHGSGGEGSAERRVARIQGQHFFYLVRQLEWVKSGRRANVDPHMAQVVYPLDGREIRAVADYVSRRVPAAELVAQPGWSNPDFPNYLPMMVPPVAVPY